MRVSVKVEYRDKVFVSDHSEMTKGERDQVVELIENAAKGNLGYLTFSKKNEQFFLRRESVS